MGRDVKEFVIRRVKESDASSITQIYNYYIKETTVTFEIDPLTVDNMLQRIKGISAKYPYFVAVENDNIVGYCYVHPWKERAAFCHTFEVTIYIDSTHKEKGLGKQMMEHLVEACKNMEECHVLIASITEENKVSLAFHKRMGFEEASLFKKVGYKFDRWLDVIDMERIIK